VQSNPLPVLPRFNSGATYDEQSQTTPTAMSSARKSGSVSPAYESTILPDPTSFDPAGTLVNRMY
jgi:hypothetical protein